MRDFGGNREWRGLGKFMVGGERWSRRRGRKGTGFGGREEKTRREMRLRGEKKKRDTGRERQTTRGRKKWVTPAEEDPSERGLVDIG